MPRDYMATLYAPDSAYHQARRWVFPHTVRCLETAMTRLGVPSTLLDVGCAEGELVRWALQHHLDAAGIDLAVREPGPRFLRADLRDPIDLGRPFQWVLCWEVAEHLPASAADQLCRTIAKHVAPKGRVLFTAAPPGQPGPGHCNCQPANYWLQKFAALGLGLEHQETSALSVSWERCAPRTPWYGRNLMVLSGAAT